MRPNKKNRAKVIGITGAIASGKSTAALYLKEHYGAARIDADRVGHEVLEMPKVVAELTKAFGEGILDQAGKVDRKALGHIVFEDPAMLERLNAITHPVICSEIEKRIRRFRFRSGGAPCLMLEAIELLRTPLKDLVDEVWVVWADEEAREERIMLRQGLSREEARARIRAQWPQENYIAAADCLIDGCSGLDNMYRALDELMRTRIMRSKELETE